MSLNWEEHDGQRKPNPLPFVAIGRAVMRGAEHMAQCVSNNFAKRVAAALNKYVPDRRGQ